MEVKKKNNWVWIDDGGEIPMSLKEAIMAARKLNTKYGVFMPINSKYDQEEWNRNRVYDLIQREDYITEQWLRMNLEANFEDYIYLDEFKKKKQRIEPMLINI